MSYSCLVNLSGQREIYQILFEAAVRNKEVASCLLTKPNPFEKLVTFYFFMIYRDIKMHINIFNPVFEPYLIYGMIIYWVRPLENEVPE